MFPLYVLTSASAAKVAFDIPYEFGQNTVLVRKRLLVVRIKRTIEYSKSLQLGAQYPKISKPRKNASRNILLPESFLRKISQHHFLRHECTIIKDECNSYFECMNINFLAYIYIFTINLYYPFVSLYTSCRLTYVISKYPKRSTFTGFAFRYSLNVSKHNSRALFLIGLSFRCGWLFMLAWDMTSSNISFTC